MVLKHYLLAMSLIVVGTPSAFARQADVIDFSGSSRDNGQSGGSSSNSRVSHSLQIYFIESAFHPPIGNGPNFGDARTIQPTPRSENRRRLVSLRPHRFMAQSVGQCDANTYSPTLWLTADLEVRRAAIFDTMASIACEFEIPTHLLDAVIAQESGYRSWAISPAGAMGIMQIMPGTARQLGLINPFDPIANMRAGARYLRQQLDRFGRVDLALAAYNAGPQRRSLRAGYVPAITETRNYVRTITINWARLAQLNVESTDSKIRGNAAITAVHASGYRSVELVRYDGLNAANPM